MSFLVFMGMLFIAGIFDLMGIILFGIAAAGNIIPVIGTAVGIGLAFLGNLASVLFIFFARLSFWLAGYNAKGMTTKTLATAFTEFIPGFSMLPGCIVFVVVFYLANKKNTMKPAVVVA